MAKRSKSDKLMIDSAILVLVGVAMFLLAFVPFLSFKSTFLSTTTVTNYSAYNLLGDLFENGFSETTSFLFMQIAVIIYFVSSILAVVFGLLSALKVVKSKGVKLLIYFIMFVATLMFMISFFVFKANDAATFNFGGITSSNVSTFIYFPLAIAVVALFYQLYRNYAKK